MRLRWQEAQASQTMCLHNLKYNLESCKCTRHTAGLSDRDKGWDMLGIIACCYTNSSISHLTCVLATTTGNLMVSMAKVCRELLTKLNVHKHGWCVAHGNRCMLARALVDPEG